ncbi:MAG: 8-oxoguanine DNA glycosylase [Candidatus Bathyarchaeota archaeon]|nr:8-oxoguanine DNA glycosylase [Candidatus Bathyarchaeota archaeon]MCX8177638.1 8-oxoguanine DNA glycosylase [Candidatus Bathyarchaeota archaeon]MDW8193894.1 DNA glycosylase [Nitrososphaerota archaeon]
MEILLDPSQPFNLELTLCCGQAFRWSKIGGWWYGIIEEKAVKIRQRSEKLEFENATCEAILEYFGLRDNLPLILNHIAKDNIMKKIVSAFMGLRILRQKPWECLISYICATNKNIPAINQMLSNLARKLGEKTSLDGYSFYTFPSVEKLAKASLKTLTQCGLGYRAEYVHETAVKILNGEIELESLRSKGYEEAKSELMTLPGVGAKVADCVLLFSLGKLEAFPVDVWIKRALLGHYAEHFDREFVEKISCKRSLSKSEYEKLSYFGRNYFGKYAGYAQEYLYHNERISYSSPISLSI